MSDRFADLHIHTHFSDGKQSPQEVVQEALHNGVATIAITDHDTVDGIAPALAEGQLCGIEVIPGIEFSTELEGRDIHILGYFIDCQNAELMAQLKAFQQVRLERIQQMIENLRSEGINNIGMDDFIALPYTMALGRPHLAALLVEKGWVKNNDEAFAKFLGDDCPAYVSKFKQTPTAVIDLIRRSGGAAVLAHPMITNKDELIPQLIKTELTGIEVYYPNTAAHVIEFYEKLAKKYDLVVTGGSDSHGREKSYLYVGKIKLPYENVEALRKRAGQL